MNGDPLVPRVSGALQARLPASDVDYLRDLAQLVLVALTAAAVVHYLVRGGRLVRLAPTG